jgi:hypothetical protein
VALEIVLTPLTLSPETFNVGDTIRVTVSFEYTVGINTVLKIYACPYYTNLFGKHMVDVCVGSVNISLTAATEPASQTATIDFLLIPKEQGGIEDGIYGLSVWIEGSNAVAEQDNVIIVTGNSSSGGGDMFTSMMPMLMMVMMMGMIMPMTQPMNEGSEEA